MRFLSPIEKQTRRVRRLWVTLGVSFLYLVLTLMDRGLWRLFRAPDTEAIARKDWYQFLRVFGYWPTWLLIGGAVIAVSSATARADRRARIDGAVVLMLGSGLAGLAAEILKSVVRRHRPGFTGLYTFDWGAGHGLHAPMGFSSSHVAVAFAGAMVLGRMFPVLRWPAMVLACGCSLTRLLAGAHYSTDILLGGVCSYAVCSWLWRTAGLPEPDRVTPAMPRFAA